MDNTTAFDMAVNHTMLYEVGKFWKLTPEVEAGLIETPAQRKMCGYTNDPDDHGGETKFGIAKSANPGLNVSTLTWDAAKRVYYKNYWLAGDCQNMPARLAFLHFDGCVNHGVGRASKFLQKSVGAVADGDIGPATIACISNFDEIEICERICSIRAEFYHKIVANNPSQGKFLNGWLTRIREVEQFVTDTTKDF